MIYFWGIYFTPRCDFLFFKDSFLVAIVTQISSILICYCPLWLLFWSFDVLYNRVANIKKASAAFLFKKAVCCYKWQQIELKEYVCKRMILLVYLWKAINTDVQLWSTFNAVLPA